MDGQKSSNRLSVCALAIAAAVTWGAGVLLLGLLATQLELGKPLVVLLGSIYIGFDATVGGSFVGAGWAFVDGLIGGFIFALVYNLTLCLCGSCCKKICGAKKSD